MFAKVKEVFAKVTCGVRRKLDTMSKPIKAVITVYFMLVAILVVTYYAAWLYQSYNGQIVMSDLLAVIKEMIGPAMIGFMTFIAGCFVDVNNNGIPDRFEGAKNNEKNNLR